MAVGKGNITTISTAGWWVAADVGAMQEIGTGGWFITTTAVDQYTIRHNSGSGAICVTDSAENSSETTSWEIDLTGLTGEYEILVRAQDEDEKEEQNLEEILRFNVVAGVAHGVPAFPQFIKVVASIGGKVTITWRYFPSEESGEGSPGVAYEARIYYDNATGTMDWVTPLDEQAMSNPTATANYSWTSDALSDDTYLFGVRIATAAEPGGVETQNTDSYEVTTNDDTPGAVDLTVAAT